MELAQLKVGKRYIVKFAEDKSSALCVYHGLMGTKKTAGGEKKVHLFRDVANGLDLGVSSEEIGVSVIIEPEEKKPYQSYKVTLSIGFPTATREDTVHPRDAGYDEEEWDALAITDQREALEDLTKDWVDSCLDYGYE